MIFVDAVAVAALVSLAFVLGVASTVAVVLLHHVRGRAFGGVQR